MNETTFPIYCEINSGASFFVIHSTEELTEFQKLGSRYLKHTLKAKILPERLLISDMIENEGNRWPRMSKATFEKHVKEANVDE